MGTTAYTQHLPQFHTGLLAYPDCAGCPLEGERIVPPEGNPRADIALVGRDPGEAEEREKRVFIGPSGGLLNYFLEKAELVRQDLWITNAVLCRAQTKILQQPDGTQRKCSPDEVYAIAAKHCRPRLLAELRAVDPKVVVPLGREALIALIPYAHSITKRRGQIHDMDLESRHGEVARELDKRRRALTATSNTGVKE